MKRLKTLAIGIAAAAVMAGTLAQSSGAVTMYDQTTGANLAVGVTIHVQSTSTTKITGTFFGIANVSISCTGLTADVDLVLNPSSWGNVRLKITSIIFSGCSSNQQPGGCTVTANGLPWDTSNNGGALASSTTSLSLATGDSGSISVGDCLNPKQTCTIKGGTASGTFGGDVLHNYVTGTWSNASPNHSLVNAPVSAANCALTGGTLNTVLDWRVSVSADPVGLH